MNEFNEIVELKNRIAEALKKPNCNQFFVDHVNNSQNNFRLALTIEEIIDKLGLSDLYVNSDKMFVRYSLND